MSPIDVWAAFAAEPTTTIILDRRGRDLLKAASAADLIVGQRWQIEGAAGTVQAALLTHPRPETGADLPRQIATDAGNYVRLVDRFYLPENPGPVVSSALFDIIAANYDHLTHLAVNDAVAERLLRTAVDGRSGRQTVLDFGCGTGVAQVVAARLAQEGIDVELIGTDISHAMFELASKRGESVISLEEWRSLPDQSFDGAVAVFVLHYGIPTDDLSRIASQLRPRGRFAANFFKPNREALSGLAASLAGFGLRLEREERLSVTTADNRLLVFRKAFGKGGYDVA